MGLFSHSGHSPSLAEPHEDKPELSRFPHVTHKQKEDDRNPFPLNL
jgi:hypothetical protein